MTTREEKIAAVRRAAKPLMVADVSVEDAMAFAQVIRHATAPGDGLVWSEVEAAVLDASPRVS